MEKYLAVGVPGSFGGTQNYATYTNQPLNKSRKLLQEVDAYTKFKPIRKRFQRRKIIAFKKFEVFQSDLADMQPFSRQNKGYRYILVTIDVLSKYVFYVPVKNKTATEMKKAFRKVFLIGKPKYLQTDLGKEFFSKEMQQFFKLNKIKLYHTFSEVKAAIAERQIRTLKEQLERIFFHRGSKKYIDILESLANQYNSTKHSRTGFAPKDVNTTNESQVFAKLFSQKNHKILKPIFEVGDQVRIYRKKSTFSKGYEKNWTDEVFTISRIKLSDPIVYYVKDVNDDEIAGSFYAQELNQVIKKDEDLWDVEKVVRKRRRKDGTMEYLVKWLGYGPEHNQWVTSIEKK